MFRSPMFRSPMGRSGPRPVLGIRAERPRPTLRGALWLACLLSAPVFVALSAVEIVWRLATG